MMRDLDRIQNSGLISESGSFSNQPFGRNERIFTSSLISFHLLCLIFAPACLLPLDDAE